MSGEQHIKKAYESILSNDFEQAIHWFNEAIVLDPSNPDYHYKLSITYARSNKLAKAIEHIQEAIRLAPDQEIYKFQWSHPQCSELLVEAGKHIQKMPCQFQPAIVLLKRAIKLDPLSVEAYLMLAQSYAGLNQYGEALRYIKEVLKLDPQHDLALALQEDLSK